MTSIGKKRELRDHWQRVTRAAPKASPEAAPHSTAHVYGAMARSSQAPVLILTAPYASAIRIAISAGLIKEEYETQVGRTEALLHEVPSPRRWSW